MKPNNFHRYAWLSIAAAVATLVLKGWAWWITDSVGLLSDALESFVNLSGAMMALTMLTLALSPADENHPYGHSKAEYFSSAFEGALIVVAALGITFTAIERLLNPRPIESVGLGLFISVLAALVNLATARILLRVGAEHRLIALEADGHHLMTDVWTTAGVLVGVGLVWLSGWLWLDPVVALLVAGNIVYAGWKLLYRSFNGLMDEALPHAEVEAIEGLLEGYRQQGLDFHALRTRQAGFRSFVSLHVLVPGDWTVKRGHQLCEGIESAIRGRLSHAHVTTHMEPIDDPVSKQDQDLSRE